MLRELQPELQDTVLLGRLQAFVQGQADGRGALPWAGCLLPQDRERLRSDLAVVLSEPEETGEPVDWHEIEEILCDWAEVAGWEGPLVERCGSPQDHPFSVALCPRDAEALTGAPSAVQRAMEVLLSVFLPNRPTDGECLPRGQLKKLNNRDLWQIDLPDAYRLRYMVDKPGRTVHIVYFGPHPSGDPRGREEAIRAMVQRQRNGNVG